MSDKIEFSDKIKDFLNKYFPERDIYSMSVEELKLFRREVLQKREEYGLLEMGTKILANAAYGACASPYFYFFNPSLAGDITGECRELTQTMWKNLNEFFREDIWKRKDLWEQFGFELDESKHDWARAQNWSIYSDTDTCEKNTIIFIKELNKYITLEEFYNYCFNKSGLKTIDNTGHEICESNEHTLNYVDGRVIYSPIRHVIRHKITKDKYRITTKSGKIIEVTNDHSCVVFRNGEQITIKAKDINPKTDKILSIKRIK